VRGHIQGRRVVRHNLKIDQQVTRTHKPIENNTPDTDTHAHGKINTPTPQTNTSHKHLTTLEGGAMNLRTTSTELRHFGSTRGYRASVLETLRTASNHPREIVITPKTSTSRYPYNPNSCLPSTSRAAGSSGTACEQWVLIKVKGALQQLSKRHK